MSEENDPPDDDKSGYCKPPKHSQFKKGVSGNPKGRPKGPGRLEKIIEKLAAAKVIVTENGEKKKMTKLEVVISAMYSKGSKGDVAAGRLILSYIEKAQEAKAEDLEHGYTEEDMKVLIEQGDWQAMLLDLRSEASGDGDE